MPRAASPARALLLAGCLSTLGATTAIAGGLLDWTGGPVAGDASAWRDLGDPPGAAERYPPQGMTLAGDRLVFSNHWNDRRSMLYLVDPDGMRVLAQTRMPARAVHTSGLGWDGERLWAVDYRSLELFEMDLEASFRAPEAVVLHAWPTGLGGASALTVLTVDGLVYLAVSDFLNSQRTYIIPRDQVPGLAHHGIPELATISYRNGALSQGLTWDGRYLYEAVNNRGVDRIEIYDVVDAIRSGDPRRVRALGSFSAPGNAVEDLATDGRRLWTSDERSFRWYVLEDLAGATAALLASGRR